MTRLSNEFQSALQLANIVIEREEVKRRACLDDHGIWNLRSRMISITSKFPDLRNPDDDKWLIDKEKIKKPRPTTDMLPPLRIPRPAAATPQVFDDMLDLGPSVVHPRARYEDIQYKIEQDARKKQEQDVLGWLDATNVSPTALDNNSPLIHSQNPVPNSIQPTPQYFRQLNGPEIPASERSNQAPRIPSFRHRIGRGGRRYIDRRSSPFTSTPLANRTSATTSGMSWLFRPPTHPAFALRAAPWVGFPRFPATPTSLSKADKDVDPDTEALAQRIQDRWKIDTDTPWNDTEHGDRTIIDDFDYR